MKDGEVLFELIRANFNITKKNVSIISIVKARKIDGI